jgi:hypothetical protein
VLVSLGKVADVDDDATTGSIVDAGGLEEHVAVGEGPGAVDLAVNEFMKPKKIIKNVRKRGICRGYA